MWAVTQGIGLANGIWSQAVYNIATLGGYTATIPTNTSVAMSVDTSLESPTTIQDVAIGATTSMYKDTVSANTQAAILAGAVSLNILRTSSVSI